MTEPASSTEDAARGPARTMRARHHRRKSAAAKMPATALVGQIIAGAGAPGGAAQGEPDRAAAHGRAARAPDARRHHGLPLLPFGRRRRGRRRPRPGLAAADRRRGDDPDQAGGRRRPRRGGRRARRRSPCRSPASSPRQCSTISSRPPCCEPWLGSDFDISDLPIPRLIAVRVAENADLAALSRRLKQEIPTVEPRRSRRMAAAAFRHGAGDDGWSAWWCSAWSSPRPRSASSSPRAARWRATASSSRSCTSSGPRTAISPASSSGTSCCSA